MKIINHFAINFMKLKVSYPIGKLLLAMEIN
jgi:hypothetical protein